MFFNLNQAFLLVQKLKFEKKKTASKEQENCFFGRVSPLFRLLATV
jgi:hypothetical protein